jgi:hypothetical protein
VARSIDSVCHLHKQDLGAKYSSRLHPMCCRAPGTITVIAIAFSDQEKAQEGLEKAQKDQGLPDNHVRGHVCLGWV